MKKSGDPLLNTMCEQEAELPAELQAPDDGEEEHDVLLSIRRNITA